MREIKFRQLVKTITPSGDNSNIKINEGGKVWHYFGLIDNAWVSPVSIQYPIMQFTGLKDKNGVEIYEGDIILTRMQKWLVEPIGSLEKDQNNYGLCVSPNGNSTNYLIDKSILEGKVIGNIYENPELIK